MSATSQLYSAPSYAAFAAVLADLDLTLLDPNGRRRMCRRIGVQNVVMGGAGVLVLQRGDGVNVTLVVYGGQSLEVQAAKIIAAGTTATNIVVHW